MFDAAVTVAGTAEAACPVAEAVSIGAARLAHPALDRAAALLAAPPRIGVVGRPGAGRRTVARALRGVGVAVAERGHACDLAVYVCVERLTPEDRGAMAGHDRVVVVMNKADLAGFGGAGPLAAARLRCREMQRVCGHPVVPLAGLVAAAAAPELEPAVREGLIALSRRGNVSPETRRRLLCELDLFGVAAGIAALRDGVSSVGLSAALCRASGLDDLISAIGRAAAPVRYRRAAATLAALARQASGSRALTDFLIGDAIVLARMTAAIAVLTADGLPVELSDCHAGRLRDAIAWQRYADGPVSALHRACATDISRGALRVWSRAA